MSNQKVVQLKKGQELFKEGATPDAMYVVKKGRLAITKEKGRTKITLAELKPGDLLGEMAFFDKSPRSAGAQASMDDTEVIELPFKALDQQWESLPGWVKSIVKAINGHLRNANVKIRQLERTKQEENEMFPSHTINMLMGILALVTSRYGTETPDGIEVDTGWLRTYTIQVYQQATNKMWKLCEVLQEFNVCSFEELAEDKLKLVIKNNNFLHEFVGFHNNLIFSDKAQKSALNEHQAKTLRALAHYSPELKPDHRGFVTLNLTEIYPKCESELGYKIEGGDIKDLVPTGLVSDYMVENGQDLAVFNFDDVNKMSLCWVLIHRLKSMQNS